MGKFKKGESGNPNGRPKGATNKDIKPIREAFKKILDDNIDEVQLEIKNLRGTEKIEYFLKFAEYCLPKMQRIEHEGDGGREIIIKVPKGDENA